MAALFSAWEIVDEVENLIDVIGLAKTGAVVTEEYRTHAIITLGAIPPAALIDYAYITFTGQDLRDVGTILRCDIFGHDIDYAATYPTYAQFAAAQRTTASVYWDPVEHDDSPQVFGEYAWITPNIKSIIQEIVDRPGYAMGNEMGLFFQPRGSTVGNDKTCVVRMNFGAFYVRWTP